ncbi:MAG: late promoter transcription accessory protein [Nitrosopumilaceae archaeon]|nr:late promoter transcription accessory protein [Nitrosopumilaceae archaeon]
MFKTKNEFCLYLERLKTKNNFDTYIETLVHFYEHETDQEMESIAKLLNKKLIDCIEHEAAQSNMIQLRSTMSQLL